MTDKEFVKLRVCWPASPGADSPSPRWLCRPIPCIEGTSVALRLQGTRHFARLSSDGLKPLGAHSRHHWAPLDTASNTSSPHYIFGPFGARTIFERKRFRISYVPLRPHRERTREEPPVYHCHWPLTIPRSAHGLRSAIERQRSALGRTLHNWTIQGCWAARSPLGAHYL